MKNTYTYVFSGFFFLISFSSCQQKNDSQRQHLSITTTQAKAATQHELAEPSFQQGSQPEAPEALRYADFTSFWKEQFVQDIRGKDWKSINAMVHSKRGIFIITPMAGVPILKRFETFTLIQNELPTFLNSIRNAPQQISIYEKKPTRFSLPSSYIVEKPNKQIVLESLLEVQSKVGVPLIEKDKELAEELALYDLRGVVVREWSSELVFARIDGKWYLVFWEQVEEDPVS